VSEVLGVGFSSAEPIPSPEEEAAVELESRWTARRREQLGVYPVIPHRDVS
jgi:hypothetical protein